MITSMIILTALLMIPINAILLMIGGPKLAGRFNSWVLAQAKRIIRGILQWVGRQVAELASRNPLATGIVATILLILLYLAMSGHLR